MNRKKKKIMRKKKKIMRKKKNLPIGAPFITDMIIHLVTWPLPTKAYAKKVVPFAKLHSNHVFLLPSFFDSHNQNGKNNNAPRSSANTDIPNTVGVEQNI